MSRQMHQKQLIGFAEQVVDCEIQLDQSQGDLSLLKKLISLIVGGIEYYQSVNDPKYLYYKDKLDAILIKNQHLLHQTRYKSPEVQAEDAIRDYEQKNTNVHQKIHSNLSVQNGCLSERLSIRRKTFDAGGNSNDSKALSEALRKVSKEKEVKIKKVVNKYRAIMSKDNFIITIEQMNKEVEELEMEYKDIKFN